MQKIVADFCRSINLFIVVAACALAVAAQEVEQNNSGAAETNSVSESVANAAQTDDDYGFDKKNAFSVWGGFAPDIPRVFGGSRRSRFGEIAFRYSRRLATAGSVAINYHADLIPFAVINYRRERILQNTPVQIVDRERETVYAAGLTPVGFQFNFRRRSKIQPFLTADAGLLIFGRKIPDDRSPLRPNQVGRRLNFQIAAGGGVEFLTSDARSYTVGFRFNHLSNNSTARINPGFDQNLFYFGYTFKKF